MLTLLRSLLSAEDRLVFALLRPDLVAACPETGARLTRSMGYRRTGRRARYWLGVPSEPPTQPVSGLDWLSLRTTKIWRLQAYTDQEAIGLAQRRLSAREPAKGTDLVTSS